MASSFQAPAGTITVLAKTKVQEKAIIDAMQAIIYNGTRKIGQTVTNKIIARTLPNTPRSGRNPSKRNVNALRQRIKSNFMGDGKDFLQALPNAEGKPIWSKTEGSTSLPVVVEKKFRGRPSKGRRVNRPDKVFEPMALVSYIKRNTEFKRKGGVAMRVRKKGADFVWTTKANLTRAMQIMQGRAGNTIFGWSSLAGLVGSAGITRSVNMDKSSFDSPGGKASFVPASFSSSSSIRMSAQDYNAPSFVQSYQQRVIDVNIPKWVNDAYKRELKYLTPAQLMKGAHVPPDVQVFWR